MRAPVGAWPASERFLSFSAEVRGAGVKGSFTTQPPSSLRKQGPSASRPKMRTRHLRKGQPASAVSCFKRLSPPPVLTFSLAWRWARLCPRHRLRARASRHGPRRAPPSSLGPRPAFASLRSRSQGDARQVPPGTEVAQGKAKQSKAKQKQKNSNTNSNGKRIPCVRERWVTEGR